jgi:hypothetical protein
MIWERVVARRWVLRRWLVLRWSSRCTPAAARFSSSWATLVAPSSGMMLPGRAASHAMATCARMHPMSLAILSTGQREHEILDAAYIVQDSCPATFHKAATDQKGARHPAVRLILTGPWPPY